MKFYNFISVILHPIVIPTIGVFLYFLLVPSNLYQEEKFAVLGLIFVTTYLIPLCILFLFKKLKIIQSYKAHSIKERKLPVAVMITLFYLLGNTFYNITSLKDLSILFYGTALGLFLIYILFFIKLKVSIHLLSMGIATSFFLILNNLYSINFLWVVLITILLSGIVASARLHLRAHTNLEVYLGFSFGIFLPILLLYLL